MNVKKTARNTALGVSLIAAMNAHAGDIEPKDIEAVKNRAAQIISTYNKVYGTNYNVPRVYIRDVGDQAGTSNWQQWNLGIDVDFYKAFPELAIQKTVRHEVAHLISRHKHSGNVSDSHGKEFLDLLYQLEQLDKSYHGIRY